jgi:hypothetical protein
MAESKSPDLDRRGGKFEDIAPEAWQRGSALAIEMLDEADLDEMALTDDCRDGRPQDNLLYRYLLRLRHEANDAPQVERAFCSVLTDYIATACDGSVWDIAGIERCAREDGPAAQAVPP